MLSPRVGVLTHNSRPGAWVQATVVSGLLLLGYAPLFPGLITDWYEHSTFSYCFLVPLIVAYLIWERWEKIKTASVEPTIWAAIPLLMAVLFGLVGQAADDAFALRVSMILVLGSTAWLLLGRRVFKALLFPLFYLALMIPVPYVLLKDITYHLRYSDAKQAANVLQLLGIPVYQEAYFLHIPNMTLEVADVCSGVSSVFAMFAIAIVYVRFLRLQWSLKFLLLACTFPFAVVANLFRIIITVVLAYNFGPAVFQSTFHALSGTVTFLTAMTMLVGLGEILRRKYSRSFGDTSQEQAVATIERTDSGFREWGTFALAVVILGAGLWATRQIDGGKELPLRSDLAKVTVPHGYTATLAAPDSYVDPNAESSLSGTFAGRDSHRHTVEVFLGYRSEQRSGNRLGSPKLYFPDKWNFEWVKPEVIPIDSTTSIHGNWMLARKGESVQLVYYWYQIENHTFAGELEHRLEQVRRSFLDRRSDGAVVRIATLLENGETIETAKERLRNFGANLYPQLVECLPS